MDEGDQIEGGERAVSKCPRCGCRPPTGAHFCVDCGAQLENLGSTSERRLLFALTLAWVFAALFLLIAPDLLPNAFWSLVLLPLFFLPAMIAYLVPYGVVIVQAVYRLDRKRYAPLGPGIQFSVTWAWALICVLYASEPLVEPFTAMPLFFFGLAVLASWVFFVIPAAWKAWRSGGFRRTGRIAGYLLPLPVAVAILIAGSSYSLRVRFELSEDALRDQVRRFERGEPSSADSDVVGLYTVEDVDRRYGCVVLQTNSGIDMAGGFAYCTTTDGPKGDFVRADHLKDGWWKYTYDNNGPR
jgi:hypothetical protein